MNTDILPPGIFNNPFCYEPHPLCILAADEVQSVIPSMNLHEGKMFGVLIVSDSDGRLGYLAAYSGQVELPEGLDVFFVPAVYDYLQPGGYFKVHEAEITALNHRIDAIISSAGYSKAVEEYEGLVVEAGRQVKVRQTQMKRAKKMRDERRKQGFVSAEEQADMIRESQFLKAEVHRVKQHYAMLVAEAESMKNSYEDEVRKLKLERKVKSDALQNWLFSKFIMVNARGERESLLNIWRTNSSLMRLGVTIPPSGSGECCEPKLLQYAFLNNLTPLCMAMFWWGESPKAEIRHHLNYYPACHAKCKPILGFMLEGMDVAENPLDKNETKELKIVYSDSDIIVVDKPAGMLSVPGKSSRESVKSVLLSEYPDISGPMMVHRLDMATSGLLVVARRQDIYVNLQKQFAGHTIRKRYMAVVGRKDIPSRGYIRLPLAADMVDRPRQKVDYENGKYAETEYEVVETGESEMLLALYPHTGRTHQLRVHCAHADGLGTAIKGDELYGQKADRLYLHACYLEFTHPTSGERMSFTSNSGFEYNCK